MEEITGNIGWWIISVVIVGIAINVASHYLQKTLDAQLSSVSSWWRERSEAQKAQRLKDLERLRDNPQAQTFRMIHSMAYMLVGIASMAVSGIAIGFWVLERETLDKLAPVIVSRIVEVLLALGCLITLFFAARVFGEAKYAIGLVQESLATSASGDDTEIGLRVNVLQKGLVILYGIYGAKGQYRDVTQRLNELMKGERLKITVNNPTLVGDDDPIKGEEKDLIVLYSYNGQIRSITRHEQKGLLLPELTL